jgi:hypothetical protein
MADAGLAAKTPASESRATDANARGNDSKVIELSEIQHRRGNILQKTEVLVKVVM